MNVPKQVSDEIGSIINSAYPVSLKSLRDILSRDADGIALDQYAASYPCELRALASCVVDALEVQRCAAEVLDQLCLSDTFRSQILRLKPELLNILLVKANSGHSTSTSICLRIMRKPLPMGVSLPATADAFFIMIVGEAISSPSATSLTAAYDLLSGACQHLPTILPSKEWLNLEESLTKIVKSSKTIQDQSLSLICLGILRALAVHGPKTHAVEVSNPASFFNGSKALKSLNLAILQAIWVSKPANHIARVDTLRSLTITTQVICAMPKDELQNWGISSEGQAAVKRLLSQCQDDNVHIDVRLMLCSIIMRVYQHQGLPAKLTSQLIAFMSDGIYLGAEHGLFTTATEHSIAHLVTGSPGEVLQQVLVHVAQALFSRTLSPLAVRNLGYLLQTIPKILCHAPHAGEVMQAQLAAFDLPRLEHILSQDHEILQANDCATCSGHLFRMHRGLARDFAAMWLAIEASCDSSDRRSERAAVNNRFLELLRQNYSDACRCTNVPKESRPNLDIVAEQCSDRQQPGRSLRDVVHAFTSRQSKWQEEHLARMMHDVCGDLEERCANVEKPLRAAEHTSARLQCQVDELDRRNKDLSQEINDLNEQISIADSEKLELQASLQVENERLIERVQTLEQALQEANISAQLQLDKLRSESKAKDLQIRTITTEKEMLLDEASTHYDRLQRDHDQVTVALEEAKLGTVAQLEEHERLRAQIDEKAELLNVSAEENGVLRDQIEDARRARMDAEALLEQSRHETQLCRDQIQKTLDAHSEALAELDAQRQEESSRHVHAVQEMAQEFEAIKHGLDEEVSQLRTSLDHHRATTAQCKGREVGLEATIHDQEEHLQQLQDLVAAKNEEIAEFQAMRQTLAAAIGHLPGRKHPRKSVHYASPVGRSSYSRRQSGRLTDQRANDSSKTIEHVAEVAPADIDLSSASVSTEDGSTPKRPKSRKPFRVPVVRQPRLSTIATPRSVKSRSQRAPLRDVSHTLGNRSPSKDVIASGKKFQINVDPKNDGRQNTPYAELNELDFGSEIFSSTPFTPAKRMTYNNGQDDETVDE